MVFSSTVIINSPYVYGKANLTKVYAEGANMTYDNMAGADLTKSLLLNANLTGADLRDADLTGAYTKVSDLPELDETGSPYQKTDFRDTILAEVVFINTTMPDGSV